MWLVYGDLGQHYNNCMWHLWLKNSHWQLKKPIVYANPCSIFASSKFYLKEWMKYKTKNIKLTPMREINWEWKIEINTLSSPIF
jgi:hypothetical protein